MTPSAIACWLSEPDGTLLCRGIAHLPTTPQTKEVRVTAVDRPGRLVHRCLLGPIQRIVLSLADGRCLPARVERLFFDPRLGRTCVLQVSAPSIPAAAVRSPQRQEPTAEHVAAIHESMRRFVADDLSAGISPRSRLHCDACRRPRPMPGFVCYAPHLLCAACATSYEMADAVGPGLSPNQFVRDQTGGAGS